MYISVPYTQVRENDTYLWLYIFIENKYVETLSSRRQIYFMHCLCGTGSRMQFMLVENVDRLISGMPTDDMNLNDSCVCVWMSLQYNSESGNSIFGCHFFFYVEKWQPQLFAFFHHLRIFIFNLKNEFDLLAKIHWTTNQFRFHLWCVRLSKEFISLCIPTSSDCK